MFELIYIKYRQTIMIEKYDLTKCFNENKIKFLDGKI